MLANTKRVISWLLVLAVEVSLPVPSHIGWAGGLGDGDCYLMEGSLACCQTPTKLSVTCRIWVLQPMESCENESAACQLQVAGWLYP